MSLWARWWAIPDILAAFIVGCGLALLGVIQAYLLVELSWVAAVVFGLVLGAAGFTTILIVRRNRRRDVRRVLDARSTAIPEHDVHRAVWGGPVPTDPETRAAALDVVLKQLDGEPPWGLLVATFAIWLVNAVRHALQDSPWWWLLIGLWGVGLAMARWRRRVRQRCADRLRVSAARGSPR